MKPDKTSFLHVFVSIFDIDCVQTAIDFEMYWSN